MQPDEAYYQTAGTYYPPEAYAAYAAVYPGWDYTQAGYVQSEQQVVTDGKKEKSPKLEIQGNKETMNLPGPLLTAIQSNEYFKGLYELKTYNQVVQEITREVDHLDSWDPNQQPSLVFCLIFKFFRMRPTERQMEGFLKSKAVYVRGAGLLYLRLCGKFTDLYSWFEPYFSDPEELILTRGGTKPVLRDSMNCEIQLYRWNFLPVLPIVHPIPSSNPAVVHRVGKMHNSTFKFTENMNILGSSRASSVHYVITIGQFAKKLLVDQKHFSLLLPRIPPNPQREINAALEHVEVPFPAGQTKDVGEKKPFRDSDRDERGGRGRGEERGGRGRDERGRGKDDREERRRDDDRRDGGRRDDERGGRSRDDRDDRGGRRDDRRRDDDRRDGGRRDDDYRERRSERDRDGHGDRRRDDRDRDGRRRDDDSRRDSRSHRKRSPERSPPPVVAKKPKMSAADFAKLREQYGDASGETKPSEQKYGSLGTTEVVRIGFDGR